MIGWERVRLSFIISINRKNAKSSAVLAKIYVYKPVYSPYSTY